MDYLGRYQQGQEAPFWLVCRNGSGVPVDPDAAPTADVYSGQTLIAAQLLVPVLDAAATLGLFAGFLYLGDLYPPGTYSILLRWQAGGHQGAQLLTFEVAAGGDPSGQVLAMTYYHQPQADFLVQQRSAGRVYQGKNPRV